MIIEKKTSDITNTKKVKHPKTPLAKQIIKDKALHLMILPSLIIVIVMAYFPMYGVMIAFKRFNLFEGVLGSPWANSNGFEHFIDFFNSPQAFSVIRNTICIAFLKLTLTMFPPVLLAIMLNELQSQRFKKITQTISYLPHFISWAVIGGLIYNFLNPSSGPVNDLLISLNIIQQPIDFISTDVYFWPLLVLSHIWKDIGWSSILYLAVIATIDPNLYEAIEIDGGGRWVKAYYVTWPYLKGTFMILFIMACGKIMSGAGDTFDQCYVFGNVANRNTSDILDTFILRTGLENARYSFATAVNLFKSIINLILLVSANALSKKLTEKSLF